MGMAPGRCFYKDSKTSLSSVAQDIADGFKRILGGHAVSAHGVWEDTEAESE